MLVFGGYCDNVHPSRTSSHPSSTNKYPTSSSAYPSSSGTYPSSSGTYPSSSNIYPSPTNGYQGNSNGYPSQSGYPTSTNVFPGGSNPYPQGPNPMMPQMPQYPMMPMGSPFPMGSPYQMGPYAPYNPYGYNPYRFGSPFPSQNYYPLFSPPFGNVQAHIVDLPASEEDLDVNGTENANKADDSEFQGPNPGQISVNQPVVGHYNLKPIQGRNGKVFLYFWKLINQKSYKRGLCVSFSGFLRSMTQHKIVCTQVDSVIQCPIWLTLPNLYNFRKETTILLCG